MNDTHHAVSIWKPGRVLREKSNSLAGMSVHALPLLLLLTMTLALRPPACAQGTCGDGTCDPSETMQSCPQDCGIVLIAEDFEDGQVQGWNYDPAHWQIVTDADAGSKVWKTLPAAAAWATTGSVEWADYSFALQVRRVNSDANIYFRHAGLNGYALLLGSSHITLWTERTGTHQDLAMVPASLGDTWHAYDIELVDTTVTVRLDGVVKLAYTDGDPLASLAGGIALEAYAPDGARFDNIQVTSLLPEIEPLDPWVQTNGPEGGVFHTVELDPADPDTVYAGGYGGVFKSSDAGASWTPLLQLVPASREVRDLILHPTDSRILYALSDQLHRSVNGGQDWTMLADGRGFSCLAMNPAAPERLLAGTPDGSVWLSPDSGATWNDVTANLPGFWIRDVAFGPGDDLWAGTAADPSTGLGFLYHSADNGASWNVVSLGQQADTQVHTLFVDPEDQNVVYVGLNDIHNQMFNAAADVYLLKTTNGGGQWTALHLPWTDAMINVMGRAPYDATLYVGTGGMTFRSADGGQTWTWIGPPGRNGDMYDIAVDPRDTRVLYLPRRAYGIVKSTDQGANWVPINDGLLNTTVSLLALADADGSTLYATSSAGEGTFRGSAYGSQWVNVTAGGIDHPWADELVVSPHDAQTIWEVADVGRVFVSEDSGSTWTRIINPDGAGFRAGTIQAVAVAASDPQVLYTVKAGFGLFKSTDGGATWSFLDQSEVDYTYSLAVDPTDPDIVFSGYNPKPFQDWAMVRRSQDGGLAWTTVLSLPHSSGITSVAIDPQNPDIVYAASTGSSVAGGGQIYRSTDGGDTWGPVNSHFTMLTVWGQPQIIGESTNASTAYAATWLGGTWKTTDAGQSWSRLQGAPLSSTSLTLDPAHPNVLYAADRAGPRFWKSVDGGLTWTATDLSSTGAFLVNRVIVAGGYLWVSTFGPGTHGGKLFRSADGGATLNDVTGTLPRSVLDVAVDPDNPQFVFVTTHIHGAYKSDDFGGTWTEMQNFPDIGGYDIEVDPVAPNIVYAAGMGYATVPAWVMPPAGYTFTDGSGVYKSEDGGQTWNQVLTTSNECRAIRLHPSNHNLLFATALTDGFFVSTDGGSNWTNANAGLDTRNLTSVWAAGNKVYAGSQGFGVYAGDLNTTTGAVTWQAARSNKPVPDVYNLQIQVDPTDSNRIYAGANPGGLFRSDDGGATWYDKNFLTPSVLVDDPRRQGYYTFAINPAVPYEVWVGTWGKGIYKSYDSQDFNIGANGTQFEMMGKHVNALLFHPILGVLAATEEGVYHTTDGGNTWHDLSAGLDTRQVRTLSVDAAGRLLAGTAGYELYERRAGDAAWTQLNALGNFGRLWPIWNNRPLYQYSTLLFHPADPSVIYFGTFPAGIYKSLDGGASWQERNVGWPNDGVFTLVFHPQDTDVVYAGSYNGLNRSLDGGAHWEMWNRGWPGEQWVFSIDFDPRDPQVMYACSKNGENEGTGREGFHGTVMKSTDGGANWFAITYGLDLNQEFYKIIVDRLNPDRLYLATQHSGVFISPNGGADWMPWNDGLTNLAAGTNGNNVTNCMVLSASGRTLYFGSAGSGVFRRTTVKAENAVYLPLVLKVQ
jgi:photosystem II stability/assembly factor-like uncharacterized protein